MLNAMQIILMWHNHVLFNLSQRHIAHMILCKRLLVHLLSLKDISEALCSLRFRTKTKLLYFGHNVILDSLILCQHEAHLWSTVGLNRPDPMIILQEVIKVLQYNHWIRSILSKISEMNTNTS